MLCVIVSLIYRCNSDYLMLTIVCRSNQTWYQMSGIPVHGKERQEDQELSVSYSSAVS